MKEWVESKGRKPRSELVSVRYRSGWESKQPYAPGQLRWTDTGEPFDITHYRPEKE